MTQARDEPMTQRNRKLAGIFLILAVLVAWSALAVAIYDGLLVGQPQLVLLAYFVVAGLGWGVPAAIILRWMSKPDAA